MTKDEHAERARVVAILKMAVAALPIPDHVGSAVDGQEAPLDANECACAPHRAHLAIRSALKEIESHQCFHCTNFDPSLGPVGSKRTVV